MLNEINLMLEPSISKLNKNNNKKHTLRLAGNIFLDQRQAKQSKVDRDRSRGGWSRPKHI
jgi:hypothetical protein